MKNSSNPNANNIRFILILVVFLGAYGGFLWFRKAKKTHHAETSSTTSQEEIPATADLESLNKYIECFNRNGNIAHRGYARYHSWVKDLTKGPEPLTPNKRQNIYGVYTIYGTQYYCDNLPKNTEMEALDAPVTKYLEAMKTLEAALRKADLYYSQEDYKDDNMTKGKEMHPILMAAYSDFFQSETEYRRVLDQLSQPHRNSFPPELQNMIPLLEELAKGLKAGNATQVQEKMQAVSLVIEGLGVEFEKENGILMSEIERFLKGAKEYSRLSKSGKSTEASARLQATMEDWENLKEDYNRLISREKEGEYVKMLYEYVE